MTIRIITFSFLRDILSENYYIIINSYEELIHLMENNNSLYTDNKEKLFLLQIQSQNETFVSFFIKALLIIQSFLIHN